MQVPHRKPGQFTHVKPDPLLTEAKFNELKNDLVRLKEVSRPFAASEVRHLAELGDFSENVEYQLAKGRLRGINNRITTIEAHLNTAQIIPASQQTDTLKIGHTVTIETSGQTKVYKILGSSETDPQKGIISHTSPVGAALIGHQVGDTVKIKIAAKEVVFKIIKIE